MDTRQKNSRIILIIIVILGFVVFTQREQLGLVSQAGISPDSAQIQGQTG